MKHIIEININDYQDVIEKFDNDKLSSELASFIYGQCMALPFNDIIEINIKTTCNLSKIQKDNIVDMIHSYFGLEVKKDLILLKHQNTRYFLLFLIGILLIAISNLDFFKNVIVISELYLIAGWVAIWEVIYKLLFEDTKKRIKLKRYKILSKARINFII